jgi:hypothetical protein
MAEYGSGWERAANQAIRARTALEREDRPTQDDDPTYVVSTTYGHVLIMDNLPDDLTDLVLSGTDKAERAVQARLDRLIARTPPCPTCHLVGPCDCTTAPAPVQAELDLNLEDTP